MDGIRQACIPLGPPRLTEGGISFLLHPEVVSRQLNGWKVDVEVVKIYSEALDDDTER